MERLGALENRTSQAGPSASGWVHKEGREVCSGGGVKNKTAVTIRANYRNFEGKGESLPR